jgi:hypothetical protein
MKIFATIHVYESLGCQKGTRFSPGQLVPRVLQEDFPAASIDQNFGNLGS